MSDIITVVGNITQPEYKVTQSGVPILSFRIASTERRFDKAEERWVDGATNWYSVSVFRRLAEHGSRSFRKGDRVVVTGRLRLRDWETAAKKGVTAEIDADALGHDLLWGTSVFHRAGGGAADAQSTQDAWAAPAIGESAAEATTDATGLGGAGWPTAVIEEADDGRAAEDHGAPDRRLVGALADTPY